jgi:hypothetical protein
LVKMICLNYLLLFIIIIIIILGAGVLTWDGHN